MKKRDERRQLERREKDMSQSRQLIAGVATLFLGIATGLCSPTISSQPVNSSVSLGAIVTNRVTASGISPFRFQWRKDEIEIAGATNRTLVLTNIQLSNAGGYAVIVTDSSGSVTSRVGRLEVDPTF